MSKRTFMTNITPLPPTIPRDVAIAMLHDHHAMIELNPLVLRHQDTHPPSNASSDEVERAVWYEITDRINYLPGGAVKGEVSYKACFYNLPSGLQTHVFAPAGVDIRSKWTIGGNAPGEPKAPEELGVNVPRDVLYIKEEVDLRCNVFMSNFVRRNLKKSHLVVADKMAERADAMGLSAKWGAGPAYTRSATHSQPTDTFLSRETSITQWSPHNSAPGTPEHQGPVHYSYLHPLHCACGASAHKRTCTLYNPEDVYEAVEQHKQKPFYAISLPSDSSLPDSSFSAVSPEQVVPLPELCGSPRQNSCFCTGALHEAGCPSYPGLRLPQMTKSGRTAHAASQAQPGSSPSKLQVLETPQLRRSKQSDQQQFLSQSLGQQEKMAPPWSPHDIESFDRDLVPSPLQTRGSV